MRLDVVIPTRKRLSKLTAALESLREAFADPNYRIHVYFDTPEEMVQFGVERPDLANLIANHVVTNYNAPGLWNAHLAKMTAGGMLGLNDDVVLHEGAYATAKNQFELLYPSYDGVLGLTQANLQGHFNVAPAAFCIVGRTFADRFPNRQVYCPDYHHLWIDRELERAAKALGRFHLSAQAKLDHFHPCLGRQYADETHNHIRQWKEQDMDTWRRRRALGLTWGLQWMLVNP